MKLQPEIGLGQIGKVGTDGNRGDPGRIRHGDLPCFFGRNLAVPPGRDTRISGKNRTESKTEISKWITPAKQQH